MGTQIWRVALQGTGDENQELVQTFHLKSDPVDPTDGRSAQNIADGVHDHLETKYLNCMTGADRLDDIKVTEEVAAGDIPEQYVRPVNLAGNLSIGTNLLSPAVCAWAKSSTGVPVRGAHGGLHAPPARNPSDAASGGEWNMGSSYIANFQIYLDALLDGWDWGLAGAEGHISYVIYSKTRRRRGETNYYFDVSSCTIAQVQHFLRSRLSVP